MEELKKEIELLKQQNKELMEALESRVKQLNILGFNSIHATDLLNKYKDGE